MKRFNDSGQMVIGLAAMVGLVAFILMTNLQSENKLLVSKIFEMRSRLEVETAIDYFGQELYKSYLLSTPVPDSLASEGKIPPNVPSATTPNGLDFYIVGKKLCSERKMGITDVPICIVLPDDFIAKLELENKNQRTAPGFLGAEIVRYLFAQKPARAEMKKNVMSQPVPGAVLTNITRTFNPAFTSDYSHYDCTSQPTVLKCVKVKICVKPSGCTDPLEKDKVIQTYVFTLAPKSQLRE